MYVCTKFKIITKKNMIISNISHYIIQIISSITTFFKKTIKFLFFSKKHNIFAQETNLKMNKIMKFEKVNDTPMRNIVGRAFIRVVKNHNLYNVFVNSFKRLKGQRLGERNPFGEFNDFHTLMTQVEKLVNEWINAKYEVVCEEMTVSEAKEQGAIGLFESKYGDRVKVYTMGPVSKEICGGPHAKNTGDLVNFKIKKEESSSAGVRRIKATINN